LKVRWNDPIDFYSGTIGFVWNRNYHQFVQDRYIFRNGIIEDVPIGRIFDRYWYQYKNFEWRPYIGAQASFENTTNGVLPLKLYCLLAIQKEQTAFLSSQLFYKINEAGHWKIRQFIKPQVILWNRQMNLHRLTINEKYEFSFNSAVRNKIHNDSTDSQGYKDIWGLE
jgi:hypothetical protein